MNGTQLSALIRRYSGTTSTTYTDANMLVDVNNVKNEIAQEIAKRNEQYFMMPALDNLVASTVSAREYVLPDTVLNNIHTVECAFDSTQATVFVPVLPYPGGLQALMRDIDGITEAKITNKFTNQAPRYFLTRRGVYILSGTISAVTNGFRLRYRKFPADLANLTGTTELHVDPTTTTFGMPLQFHELWARRVSIIFKSSRPKPIPLTENEKRYDKDLENALDSISDDDYGSEEFGLLPREDTAGELGQEL